MRRALTSWIMADLVTKADMEIVHSQFAAIQGQFDRVQNRFDRVHAEIATLRSEWREDFVATKRDLQGSMESMRRELTALIAGSDLRVTVRLGAIMTLGIGILAALIKL
jgi:hypothetical protein